MPQLSSSPRERQREAEAIDSMFYGTEAKAFPAHTGFKSFPEGSYVATNSTEAAAADRPPET